MRIRLLIVLLLGASFSLQGQTPSSAKPELPKDPRALFADAAPFYNFSDPSLKPWHLKASYQLYDENGKPAQQGTYEYWWASPSVYRSTWTRSDASHTDWQTADGKHLYQASGERLSFFEYKLQTALLSPLPDAADLDPAKFRLQRDAEKLGGPDKYPCIMVIPLMPQHGQLQSVPFGLFPTYCFAPSQPVLMDSFSFGTVATQFNRIAKVQGRYLPLEISFYEGKREILSAKVESVNGIAPAAAALTPPTDALKINPETTQLTEGVTNGMLIKKQPPVYPQDAKDARITGTVALHAIIGVDGGVHDLRVIEAPWPSLVASALICVSKWQYKPYLLNGEPTEVETTIRVIYTMSQ
jgi:TonB family protein